MKKNIRISSEFNDTLLKAHEFSKERKLISITAEAVIFYIIEKYVKNGCKENEFLVKFFDSLDTDEKNTLYSRALKEMENMIVEDKFSFGDSRIPFSRSLHEILNRACEISIELIPFTDDIEMTDDLFLVAAFEIFPKYLDGIDIDLDGIKGDIKLEAFGGTLKEKRFESLPTFDDFMKKLGFGENESTKEDMKKDDDEFEEAGRSTAVSGKAVDPNSKTPYLDQFSFNMTEAAKKGKYDPVIGRDKELSQIIKILGCRKKNNAILLGDPGCGKTAIVEALAMRIQAGNIPQELEGKRICSLDLNALVSGTKYRGEYEERLQGIIKEVCENKNIIVYIDEFHNLIGNGSSSGSGDGANILKPYLARGEFQCIGSTTQEEYRKFVKDGALKRRFQAVSIEEPGINDTIQILKGIAPKYEEFHKVKYPAATIKACVELAGRYVNDKFFPDKAIDLMDTAGAQIKLSKVRDMSEIEESKAKIEAIRKEKNDLVEQQEFEEAAKKRDEEEAERKNLEALQKAMEKAESSRSKWPEVTPDHVASVISELTGVPVDQIQTSDIGRLKTMKKELSAQVIGQDEAVDTFVTVLQRNFLGLRDETKSIANILLTGPSGTGKTLICEKVAEGLFGSKESFIKFNMGEMTSEHEVSKLIGSPAGYVGYDDEPLLLKVKRHPSSLVLFDEIEKAHPKIFDIFLGIMDKGEIVLSNGETVDFRNTIVVFTGNIGTKDIKRAGKGLGFTKGDKNEENKDIVKKAIEKTFRPEFINRLTHQIVFNELGIPELTKIFDIELGKLKGRLKAKGLSLKVSKALKDKIVKDCDTGYGARDLQRGIQKMIETEICTALLKEDSIDGITGISVDWEDDKVTVEFNKKGA